MPFNVSKCQVMHLGKDNTGFDHFIGNHKFEEVKEERDMGVQLTNNLKPPRQCQLAYSKAIKVPGMIGRTISYNDADPLVRLYKSLVRQHLKYCVSTWSPSYIKDSKQLERLQHRYAAIMPKLKNEKRLKYLGLWTLEERRNRADLLEVFKMYKRLLITPFKN